MEEQAVTMLTSLASRTRDSPEVKTRVESHLAETRRQIEALEECIKRRSGEASTLKDVAAKIVALGQVCELPPKAHVNALANPTGSRR